MLQKTPIHTPYQFIRGIVLFLHVFGFQWCFAQDTLLTKEDPRNDTVAVRYFTESDDRQFTPDSTLNDFQVYNPARQLAPAQFHLGNLGSPIGTLIWQPKLRKGFFTGFEQFDVYRLRRDQLKYFNSKLPFTDLFYSQAGQSNNFLRARFGYHYTEHILFSFEYSIINALGTYAHQRGRIENYAFGMQYRAKKYSAIVTYVNNKIKQEENGGFANDDDLNNSSTFSNLLAVRNTSALTDFRFNELNLSQFYKPTKQADTWLSLQTTWRSGRYKYYDENPATDSSYYGDFQTNNRAIRQYTFVRTLHNELAWRQALGRSDSATHAPFLLSFGLTYDHHWVEQEPIAYGINDVFANGNLRSNPLRPQLFNFEAYAHIGLADNAGDYAILGKIYFDFKKWGTLEGSILNQLYRPAMIQQRLFVSRTNVWNNDFSPVKELSIAGTYTLNKWGFKGGVQSHTIGNLIYFDENAQPHQASGALTILQIFVNQNIKIWRFHLDNQVTWQRSSSSLIPTPEWVLRHVFYFETPLFKKHLKLRLGIDARYNSNYKGFAYLPLTGQFHLQNERILTFVPQVDAFLSAKVQRFRVFLLVENLTKDIFKEGVFTALHYAMMTRQIRLGISWYLAD